MALSGGDTSSRGYGPSRGLYGATEEDGLNSLRNDIAALQEAVKTIPTDANITAAVAAAFAAQDTKTPTWAAQLTADVNKLRTDHDSLHEQLRVTQATRADLNASCQSSPRGTAQSL